MGKLSIDVLGLTEKKNEKLIGAGLGTLGELHDYWQTGKSLRDIKGVGEALDTEFKDAFSDYGAEHPEVFGEQATPDAMKPGDIALVGVSDDEDEESEA